MFFTRLYSKEDPFPELANYMHISRQILILDIIQGLKIFKSRTWTSGDTGV
jgi:hypothetical protein